MAQAPTSAYGIRRGVAVVNGYDGVPIPIVVSSPPAASPRYWQIGMRMCRGMLPGLSRRGMGEGKTRSESVGRVAPGRCLPGAPTDPDVRDYRIRLFETGIRYVTRSGLGFGSGNRRRIRGNAAGGSPRCERRRSHRHHSQTTRYRKSHTFRRLPMRLKYP
jgi:hypothetical protein